MAVRSSWSRAARRQAVPEIGVGDVHRAGQHAVLLPFAPVAQVHQEDLVALQPGRHLPAVERPATRRHVGLGEPDVQVGGDRDVHHLRVREVQVVHHVDVLFDRLHLKARVARLLLADGADGVALVVVGGVDEGVVGELEQALEQGVVLGARVAVLEVGASGAPDEQGIAGEDALAEHEAQGVVGVARGVEHVEADALHLDAVAVRHPHRDDVHRAALSHHRDAPAPVAQRAEPGDVIGVDVGVYRLDQLQIQLVHEPEVAVHLLQHGVDDQRLSPATACDQVGVGAGDAVEELAEEHRRAGAGRTTRTDYRNRLPVPRSPGGRPPPPPSPPAGNRLVSRFEEPFRTLNETGARCVVVGGPATVPQGCARLTAQVVRSWTSLPSRPSRSRARSPRQA